MTQESQKAALKGAMAASMYHSTKSLTFDGISDWAANFNLFGISTFPIRKYNISSVSMWVKSTKNSANPQQTIVGRWFPTYGGGLAVNEGGWRWFLSDLGTGNRQLHFHLCTHFLNGLWITSTDEFPLNEWVHVTMTYDGTGGSGAGLKMYWDGVEVSTNVIYTNWTSSAVNSNAYSHLLWGCQYTAWPPGSPPHSWPPVLTYWFEGGINEACFWRHELDADEVLALYNNGYPESPCHVALPDGHIERYFRMGEWTDGTPWISGYSISWNRHAYGGTNTNMFWNNDGAIPPLRVVEDVAP